MKEEVKLVLNFVIPVKFKTKADHSTKLCKIEYNNTGKSENWQLNCHETIKDFAWNKKMLIWLFANIKLKNKMEIMI